MNDERKLRDKFPPGTDIIIEYANEEGAIQKDTTSIEDLEGEYLVLNTPQENNTPAVIIEGQELTLRHVKDPDSKAYVTSVFVIENRPDNKLLLVCNNPREISHTSLRRFTRYDVELPASLIFDDIIIYGKTVDLSLSGCNLALEENKDYDIQGKVDLTININQGAEIIVTVEVTRCYEISEGRKNGLALVFYEMTEATRESLKDFLFQCQLLEKGILGGKQND